jgi:cytochrome c oxidase subunit II
MSQVTPPSASDWNSLFNAAALIAIAALAVVMAAMIYFTVRYRARGRQGKFIPEIGLERSRARETVVFASISIIILLSLAIASYRVTPNARFPPSNPTMTIDVTALQWAFMFRYPNGATTVDVVNVPANASIVFNVTSIDVMHNFYLVEYRVSIDAIPGRYNIIWIDTPQLDGSSELNYTIRCKELCGPGHTHMMASLHVMDPAAFQLWLNNQTSVAPGNSTMNMSGG